MPSIASKFADEVGTAAQIGRAEALLAAQAPRLDHLRARLADPAARSEVPTPLNERMQSGVFDVQIAGGDATRQALASPLADFITGIETSLTAHFALVEQLSRAKDVQEVLAIQAEFVARQLKTWSEQSKMLGIDVQKSPPSEKVGS